MIIGLGGLRRSGKDTLADVLVRDFKYVKVSLASSLRNLCSNVFQIEEQEFTRDDTKERLFSHPIRLDEEHLGLILSVIENDWEFVVTREQKDKLLAQVGIEMKHPRHVLQIVGTDLIRNCIDSDLLLKVADRNIANLADVVIADVRFANERRWLEKKGALLCLVNRPNQQSADNHISENDLGNESEYKIIFNNDDTLNRFRIEVNGFFNNYLSRARY